MKTQISIIGCGWLGLSLAQKLVEEDYTVNGSTTSKDKLQVLQKHRINPFLITLTETSISGSYSEFLTGSATVIINIPPGLRNNPNKNHVAEIKLLIYEIEKHGIKNVLYISSTSVFEDGQNFPVITDKIVPNTTSESGKQLIEIEQMLQANSNFKTTILRFGGLVGDERHPAKFLSGKTNISNPEAPINLIHKTDCLAIISSILKNKLWNITLNAAYPEHPNKDVYYVNYCKHHNLPLPKFNSSEKSKGKIIESKLVVQLLNYTFKVSP
ncbi:NAD(P)H-binding protein [Winogradskyella thalassocola]|uniref:Nucleoside-diphosphate-sugar epimerase n=1 Tax=Winogradskyella thalassocola TaxID=262004 RepID=A0A1G7WDP9_9FLAO|nr:NAD(P)H-binding protein [Winogradskyella thalassocola]SDG70092.1 Nucleoside-diphosphate-sugar epimerase [Winogradskyella thalassocola]